MNHSVVEMLIFVKYQQHSHHFLYLPLFIIISCVNYHLSNYSTTTIDYNYAGYF